MNVEVSTTDLRTENGKVIITVPEDKIKQLPEPKTTLSDIEPGEAFKVGEFEFILISHTGCGSSRVLSRDSVKRMRFDSCSNNYAKSEIRKYLNGEFYEKLAAIVGTDNIVQLSVDLTADDGLKDYGIVSDFVSIISADDYRNNRKAIGESLGAWWWTRTADSPVNSFVRVVYSDGTMGINFFDYGGVRPFCILNSSISVSKI